MEHSCNGCPRGNSRRLMLKKGLGGLFWAAIFPRAVLSQANPAALPPQVDDVLVKSGDSKPLTPSDIPADASYVSAWPMSPGDNIVRNGSRLNELLLVRLAAGSAASADDAGGVVAYSALCSHGGCNVTTWIPDKGTLSCECHASDFDARSGGRVLAGPASRALPQLHLKLTGELLSVARPFAATIRFDE